MGTILRKCPSHGIQPRVQIQTFYNRLMDQIKTIVDSFMIKTYEEAFEVMEKLASNHHQMVYDRVARKATLGVFLVDAYIALSAHIDVLTKHMQGLRMQP